MRITAAESPAAEGWLRSARKHGGLRAALFSLSTLLVLNSAFAALAERCMVCGAEIVGTKVYLAEDKIDKETKHICYYCSISPNICFLCGLPVWKDFLQLSDGRFLCARDTKKVVLDSGVAKDICADVKDKLERMLSRFLSM